jgi:hypothetical protein
MGPQVAVCLENILVQKTAKLHKLKRKTAFQTSNLGSCFNCHCCCVMFPRRPSNVVLVSEEAGIKETKLLGYHSLCYLHSACC